MFQEDPGLFARAFNGLGYSFPEGAKATNLPTDLTEIQPVERRVDTLLRMDFSDGSGFVLAVESQLRKDPGKHHSWAYYVAYLYTKYRIPPILLVVCHDQATALWAEKPIDIGFSGRQTFTVRPLVLGPHNLPMLTDPAAAAKDIPLASLSAIAHRNHPDANRILKALALALQTTDEDETNKFGELTELGLGDDSPAAQQWRDLMVVHTSFFKSQSSQLIRAEGRAQGEAHARAEVIVQALGFRGLEVTDAVRDRVTACTDVDTLQRWFARVFTATTAEDIFTDA